jgi:alpha-ketoglutarate-dependent 2,4-dichlorophenoxyacetate dioxygenase
VLHQAAQHFDIYDGLQRLTTFTVFFAVLRDLMDHATQRQFVHAHAWRPGDLVIWDNLATMHRGRPFADGVHRRELRRVTTLDIELSQAAPTA